MARLEDITVGSSVAGLAGGGAASVVAVKWHGTNAITVTFRNGAGSVAEQILFREDEARLDVKDGALPWSFDADAGIPYALTAGAMARDRHQKRDTDGSEQARRVHFGNRGG